MAFGQNGLRPIMFLGRQPVVCVATAPKAPKGRQNHQVVRLSPLRSFAIGRHMSRGSRPWLPALAAARLKVPGEAGARSKGTSMENISLVGLVVLCYSVGYLAADRKGQVTATVPSGDVRPPPGIPSWVNVSKEQTAEANKLGIPVAFANAVAPGTSGTSGTGRIRDTFTAWVGRS